MLRSMVGRRHALVTAVALVGPGFADTVTEETVLSVRADLDDAELEAYVATGEGSGCAGGYAAEGRGAFLFERIEGDFFNVLGLPLLRVIGLLRARGWRFE
jgi:septum formation protein